MQGLLIAVIGAIGLALPSLIAISSAHLRRLNRISQEAELLGSLPPELEPERRLARLMLRNSLWEYAMARERPYKYTFLILGAVVSSTGVSAGFYLVLLGHSPGSDDLKIQDYRTLGFQILFVAVPLYVAVLCKPFLATRRRVDQLSIPSSLARQVVAFEADWVESSGALVRWGDPEPNASRLNIRSQGNKRMWKASPLAQVSPASILDPESTIKPDESPESPDPSPPPADR